jgi:hypothetical protein
MVMPGWGTLIGAGIGAIGGYFGGVAARKKEREIERLEEKIMNMLGIKKFTKFYNRYLPIIRSQIAAGIGPALEQKVAQTISARGLSGTGLGEVLRNLAPVATGLAAQGQAGAMARNTQLDKARALGAQISRKANVPVTNPLLGALQGMASGGFAGAEMDKAMGERRPLYATLDADEPNNPFAPWQTRDVIAGSDYIPGYGYTGG